MSKHFLKITKVKPRSPRLLWWSKSWNMYWITLQCAKGYNTWCSQAVTHPSTNQALRCLTSVIRREPVHSTWYGRSRQTLCFAPFISVNHSQYCNTLTYITSYLHVIFLFFRFHVQFIGQQSTFADCFQIKLINRIWNTYLFNKFITTIRLKAKRPRPESGVVLIEG